MKCYYEVLNVPRDADDATIKSAYKKLALKWHPDKNLDNPDEAKDQFQLVQQAYEVLSDRQERAWYDNHREQILHASNHDFEDKSLDLFQYFTTSCFKGYNDDDNGFYTVYRKVFEEIAKEDLEFIKEKDEFFEIPNFGKSQSDYATEVGPFYAYWSNYSTKKSFVWLDPYNITEVRGGKILKLMEKENKKVRQKAKKERNEEVRNLVAFVRKRDKRVQAQTKLEEIKRVENRKKLENISRQKKLERQQQLNNSGHQAEWTKFDNVQSELEQIEKHLAQEFGDELSDCEDEEDIFNDNLYCIACNKLFKNPKAFESHESSKKHKERAAKIREELLADREETSSEMSGLSDDERPELLDEAGLGDTATSQNSHCRSDIRNNETQPQDKPLVETGQEENRQSEAEPVIQEENRPPDSESVTKKTRQRKKKNKKQNVLASTDQKQEPEEVSLAQDSDSDFDFSSTNKQKRKESKKQSKRNKQTPKGPDKKDENSSQITNNIEHNLTENIADELPVNDEKLREQTPTEEPKEPGKKQKKAKKNSKQALGITKTEIEDIDVDHCCAICKANFSSKNKLFDHLKKTGHSVYLPTNSSSGSSRNKKTKNK